jgi:hypothetical protein
MAGLRTASHIEAEYTAVREAYLRALQAESYSQSDGGEQRSAARAKVKELREQMEKLDAEYQALNRGGIQVRGVSIL